MLNIRKRFFLLLTIVGLLAGLASCTNKNDYVQVKIEADEYVIVVGETIEVAPVVNKGDSVSQVTLVYTSQDENVATYSNGFVTGNSVGQTVVKAYCQEKAIAYDTVVITVIQDRLPGMDFGDVKASMLKTTTQQLECTFDPAEAEENVALSYVSSNPEVATVDENGLITAVKAGKVTITVVALNLLYENETREIKFEIEVLETDFAINYELNGGQNAESNPAGYDVFNLPIALADASKVGYTFAGWYDNAEFAGEPVTEIAANSYGDITLYAKWDVIEYTVSYDLAGGEGAETNPTTYTVEDTPYALAAPTRLGYKFLGWYAGDAKVESLTVEALGNLELVAKWELVQYSITYNLNGGDWTLNPGDLYEYGKDHAALVADFIIDFNKHSGKTVAADGSDFFARSWMADGSSAGYNFLVSAEYSAKWGWLVDVINEARVARGAAELSANDGQAEARGEVHNFLNLCAPGEKGGNASFGSDYTGAEAYWSKLLKIEILNSYNIASETFNLPVPVRYGYEFLGWYNEADEEVVAVETGSTGNLVVSAKWEIEEYSITYNYNGGLLSIYQYPSRDALVEDFLADYNTARNKSHTAASFAALGSWGEISDASLFLYNETYRAKWAWLVDYIASVAGSANKKAWEAFNNYNSQKELNAANSNYIYSIAYELRGFVGAIQYSKNKNYVTADYSQDAIGNGFWNLIVKPGAVVPVESYVYTDGTIALGAPEKAGNEFLGWYLDGVKVESIDAAVAKDLVLEAKWSHDPIAINYVLNGGELAEEDAKTFNYAEGLAALPTPTKLGYTFVGWYSDEACTEKVESIAAGLLESVTLYAAWELTVYNISYELNGGEFIRDEVVELYYELDVETEEHLPAYDLFVADFIADYSAFTGVADVTAANFYGKSAKYGLYSFFKDEEMGAKWSWLLDYVATYANEVKYNGRAYLVLTAGVANFNKYARTNVAALLQQTLITNVSPISMNFKEVDGEAFWTACPDQIIQVGTEAVNEYTIAQLPVALATPNKKGAEFVGWYTNADLKNGKVSEITLELLGDITLYARWSDSVINFDTYNITYELDGGALVEGAPTTYVEETGVELKPATRAGYEFKGWYLDAACTQAVTEFTALDKGDKVVYASWEAIEYAITYNAGEGTLPTITIQVGDYADWAALVADFVVDFNAFSGKVVQPDGSDFFARSYMGDGSSAGYNFLTSAEYGDKWGGLLVVINETRVARGAAALKKDDGQAEARGEIQNLLTKSSTEAGVTAGYGSDYTSEEVWGKVWDHFELIHDEVVLAPTNYTVEDLPYTLAIPGAPAGKEFAGWYDNAELAGEPIYVLPVGTLGDVELWAKYESAHYQINYELNEGVNNDANPDYYTSENEVVLLAPTRFGYDFVGWELNSEIVEKIEKGSKGELTLIAKWAPKVYTIEYILNDGVLPEGAVEEFEHDSEVILPTPSREGYTFLGWVLNNQYVEELENQNYVLEAKWKANDQTGYEVIFDLNGGQFEQNFESFVEEFIADFSRVSGATIDRVNFKDTTGTPIKNFLNKADMLAKYKGLLEFSLAEISTYTNMEELSSDEKAYYDNTILMLEGMIAGDTNAVNINDGGNARTIYRWYLQGLLNKTLAPAPKGMYDHFMVDYSVEANLNRFLDILCPVQRTVEPNEELPVAVKENHIFLGWYVDGVKVQYATGDDVLVAEWIHVDDYEWSVEFDLAGGYWLYEDFESFVKEFIADFSRVSGATIDRVNFKDTTGTPIKNFLNKADMLAKYKWLLEFSLAEISTYTNMEELSSDEKAYYDNTILMLEGMIAGDTNAVNINDGGNARTIYRWYLQGLLNKTLAPAPKGMYDHFMVDYSVEANLNRFLEALANADAAAADNTYTSKEVLPTPNKDGHLFLGWYDGETKVESVKSNCTLVAKWVDIATLKYTISYDVAEGILQEGATTEFGYNEAVVLPVPTRDGYKFLGWYEGETLVEKVENKDYVLVAKWEAQNAKAINYELDGGKLPEGAPTEYNVGKGLETLPTPTKTGYEFVGWYSDAACTQAVTSISADATEDVTLYAQWKKAEVKLTEVYVGAGKDYATLDEAIAGVEDNTRIILAAGEYELTAVINKSVEIVGPNANKEYAEFSSEEALVKVAKDIAGNIAAKSVVFNGVHLQGTGGGAGIPGVFFQDGGNVELLKFVSCEISDMNTFVKFINAGSNLDLVIEKSKIHSIGQFIVWTTNSINATILKDSYVDGSTCGAVTNANAALFRIRKGSFEAYNNYFIGDSKNAPGYFECVGAPSYVKYNTFDNVVAYVFEEKENQLVFDNNLYLDSNGEALSAAPAFVRGTGVTADTKVSSNATDLYNSYIKYLKDSNPNRYFNVTFEVGEGEITSSYPEVYDSEAGIANLPTALYDGYNFLGWLLDGTLIESVPAGTTGDITLVALFKEDALYVGEGQQYATLAEALAAAQAGDKIILLAGTYEEDVKISVAGLTIAGPNQGVNANSEQRVAEAIIKGVITIQSSASDIRFDGLSFTGNAKIQYIESTTFDGFTFENNKVYDTRASEKAWDESRYGLPGFIQFTMTSGGEARNVEIYSNSFVNVPEVNVLINRANNLTVDGNVFKDFGLDAIRTEGGLVYGILAFTNNVFEQTNAEQGGLGIFLYSNAGGSGSTTNVIIDNNEFIKVGRDNGTVFTSAIGGYRYQENYTTFTIKNNIFDHCYDYLYIRNNGGDSSIWFCTVENNQFLGLPHNQYYGSYRGSDSESTNPHLAVFTQNYYEDNEGNVITDLSQYADYFKHMASYGTALAAKPGEAVTEPVEFWSITYNLNGGTTRDAFVYKYNSLNNAPIALPTLTKANHQFNGWLLEGELVNEIPADAKGNLALVADFTVLEGEVYNIEFVTNKENALWPYRAAYDLQEILDALYADLYEWAQGNGETKSFAEYKADIDAKLAAYTDIKLRNTKLGNYPAEDGSTEYFLNVPKYYQKWADFFAVFNKAMLAVNPDQNFYTDTYATMVRMYQFTQWTSTGESYFKSYLPQMYVATKIPQEIPTTYRGGQIISLPQLHMENGLEFLGWYDNAEFTGTPVTQILSTDTGDKTFYAKWAEEVKVENIDVNTISELLLFTTHQLVWTISPDNVTDKSVEFFSSDESVAIVNSKGLITAVGKGTTTITIKVYGNREKDVNFDLTVYTDDFIDGSYYSESYMEKDDKIQLVAEVVRKDGTTSPVKWSSLTPEIATVDENGVVTALAVGTAKIVAIDPNNETLTLEFVVTVLEEMPTGILELVINANESNIFTRYDLNIGGEYTKDILGSVSNLLTNYKLEINDKYYAKTQETGYNGGERTSTEFITVHYTGNMASGADADANASYFSSTKDASIHYTTGNDGIFYCTDEKYVAWHAGDSGSVNQVGHFEWFDTGVNYKEGDPQYPVFTISDDFYFEINGQKTTVKMPNPWNYSGRGTDHILNADGTISSQPNFGQTGFANREAESFINDMGLPFKVENGKYFMGKTWWCYTQVYEGRICSNGGNYNSIGIESCVNEGSDLWYTWQITAKLVADIMERNNLDITRVRGHHFFSGKNCPQPMLENDCEIWREFLELVEAEYELLTEYEGYEITMKSNNPDIVSDNGRVIKQPSETTCVTYTVTIVKDGQTQSITLASMVKGLYAGR